MKRINLLLMIMLTVLALAACTNFSVKKPAGFAEIVTPGIRETMYKAVSPEGMLYRVRTLDNYPKQDLEFWSNALKNHLQEEGYALTVDGESFQAGKHAGMLFEWALPYGQTSYLYLTAIVVSDEKIAVAEAAAEYKVYTAYREALKESLQTIIIKQ